MSASTKKFIKVLAPLALAALMIGVSIVLFTTMAAAKPESAGAALPPPAAPPAADCNRLRVYGRCTETAAFPYTTYTGVLSIQDAQNPPKDFVVFNPAYIAHRIPPEAGSVLGFPRDIAQPFVGSLRTPEEDANEKVHLRMWYVPEYEEPTGKTHPSVPSEKYFNPEIVLEYTYILLDVNTNDPTCGGEGTTFVFPMAGIGDKQVGLDRFDVNGDGTPEIMVVEKIIPTTTKTTTGTIVVSTKETVNLGMQLFEDPNLGPTQLQFFDYMVTLKDIIGGDRAQIEISYIGNREKSDIGSAVLTMDDGFAWNGEEKDAALVEARHGPIMVDTREKVRNAAEPIEKPFWVTLDFVGSNYVTLRPHRFLTAGWGEAEGKAETFFVDGAEYDVAAILIENGGKIKFITIRNPLPKSEDVKLHEISVVKEGIPAGETLPVLPPFNYDHHMMVDDINIPDCIPGDSNTPSDNEQRPDNVIGEGENCPCEGGWGRNCGCTSCLHKDYNTIAERIWGDDLDELTGVDIDGEVVLMPDLDALQITWIQEEKEPRFDTNLLEEKFTETIGANPDEMWQWKNIETLPWDYTEFQLPKLPDVPTEPGYTTGDYILVSSFLTEDATTTTIGADGCIRMKFVFDAEESARDSADIYVNDIEYNEKYRSGSTAAATVSSTLRVYGRCTETAAFPYTTYTGVLSIQHWENPPKDFVVFNPAFLDNNDPNAHEQFGPQFFNHIKADTDACEKVHLRMWYVPKRVEPKGATYPEVSEPITTSDIVLEYTYILLDPNTLNPTHGSTGTTQLVFPMAGLGGQVGLDRYDVNGDGTPEIMVVEEITPVDAKTTTGTIAVAAHETVMGGIDLEVGESLDFFDYRVTLNGILPAQEKAEIQISYIGNRWPIALGLATLAGTDAPTNTAVVKARNGPVYCPLCPAGSATQAPVVYPFWVSLEYVGTNYATLIPHRYLTAGYWDDTKYTGETFFVDGAEYDVAAILIEASEEIGEAEDEFKFITIRNPLPKDVPANECGPDGVEIPELSVWKECIPHDESLPMLPPFNYTHDMIDDINIPDCIPGNPNTPSDNEQRPDNVIGEGENCPCEGGWGRNCGCTSCLHKNYNTIAERIVRDVGALDGDLLIAWIAEEKEPRFDTNLCEEKFTETIGANPDEMWQWKNIETLPWDYTEFVLPALPDKPTEAGYDYGDYILVSSFLTEDATTTTIGADGCIRMKFVFDPAFKADKLGKTGIYVNTEVGCPCIGDFDFDRDRDIQDLMLMALHWNTEEGEPGYEKRFDIDDDNDIDTADLMLWIALYWNKPCPPA